jgi:flagellar biosynthesis/type III secretory pathway ATPase
VIEIGAYSPGVSRSLDMAVHSMPKIRPFLWQSRDQMIPRIESLSQLRKLAAMLGADNDSG